MYGASASAYLAKINHQIKCPSRNRNLVLPGVWTANRPRTPTTYRLYCATPRHVDESPHTRVHPPDRFVSFPPVLAVGGGCRCVSFSSDRRPLPRKPSRCC